MNAAVNELMATPEMAEAMEFVRAKLAEDAETCKMMETVSSLEDVYEITKKYVTVKFETFKKVCSDMMDYFKEDKATLSDDILDNVTGGWSLSKFWNNVVVGTIIGVCTVAGAVIGTALTAASGAGLAGCLAGGALGYGVTAIICDKTGIWFE